VCAESVSFQIYVPGNRILNKVVARIQRNLYYLFIYARSLQTSRRRLHLRHRRDVIRITLCR